MPRDTTPTPVSEKTRRVLRREMTTFFTTLRTAQPGWPAVPDQEFIDALADSLIEAGKAGGKGVAHLQTLVHELQDRVNTELNKG